MENQQPVLFKKYSAQNWHLLKISGKKQELKSQTSKFKFENFATFVWRGDFTPLPFEGPKISVDVQKRTKVQVTALTKGAPCP